MKNTKNVTGNPDSLLSYMDPKKLALYFYLCIPGNYLYTSIYVYLETISLLLSMYAWKLPLYFYLCIPGNYLSTPMYTWKLSLYTYQCIPGN